MKRGKQPKRRLTDQVIDRIREQKTGLNVGIMMGIYSHVANGFPDKAAELIAGMNDEQYEMAVKALETITTLFEKDMLRRAVDMDDRMDVVTRTAGNAVPLKKQR